MRVYFHSKKLQKAMATPKAMASKWGDKIARKLSTRLAELTAADHLADIERTSPARCHELTANRKGQLSVDLAHPYRLIFIPADDPIPRKLDGGLDWSQVSAVEILEVADTHE